MSWIAVQRLLNLFGLGIALALSTAAARGQALEEMRDDVRTSTASDSDDHKSARQPNDSQGDGYDESDYNWGEVLLLGLVSPFWGPPALIGDDYAQSGYFPHYPHQYDRGYMLIGSGIAELPEGEQSYVWAARLRAEYGTDFDNINWAGGHVLLETSPRLGIEFDFRNVNEQRNIVRRSTHMEPVVYFSPNSDWATVSFMPVTDSVRIVTKDSLWFGDSNLLYRFAQSEWLVMRAGLGCNFLSDSGGTNYGFNFTYGGDFFPVRPFVFSGELDIGTLGHTNAYHVRVTAGANWRHLEAYIGYDYYDIGPTQIAGLVTGVRLWY